MGRMPENSGEFEDELPVAAQGSGCWCLEEELSLRDTSASPPLWPGPPVPTPPWLLQPSNSAQDMNRHIIRQRNTGCSYIALVKHMSTSNFFTCKVKLDLTDSEWSDCISVGYSIVQLLWTWPLLLSCGQTHVVHYSFIISLTLSISFLEAEIFGFLWMENIIQDSVNKIQFNSLAALNIIIWIVSVLL